MLAIVTNKVKTNRCQINPVSREIVFAPETNIPYRPGLVDELKKENRRILIWFKLLLMKITNQDLIKSQQILVEIKRTILAQFMRENNLLFVYLKAIHKNNPFKYRLIKELKREMVGVQSMMFYFFNSYLSVKMTIHDLEMLGRELNIIGQVLYRRFKRHETVLYPMYTELCDDFKLENAGGMVRI